MNKQIELLVDSISKESMPEKINIMEVCGTHTMTISRWGLRQLLPSDINLISGPGCPVCVTDNTDIDTIIELIRNYQVTLFTFGDMIRVPGSISSLYYEKSKGKDINICYSPLDALDFATSNPDKTVIFLAIGFETTIPLTAVLIKKACQQNLDNFYIYSTHKLIPPALEALLLDKETKIDAFLCPGHVSTIIGSKPYQFVSERYNIPCVISGFEPQDVLMSISMIQKQLKNNAPKVEIQYTRAVKEEGNTHAVNLIYDVFRKQDSVWRGLGRIVNSGLELKEEFEKFDAKKTFKTKKITPKKPKGCQCGNILKGIKKPTDCELFCRVCNPQSPVGPCMVSSEGTCAAYFRYEGLNLFK